MYKKFILSLIIIYSLMLATACPSRKGLTQAFNQSAKVYQLGTSAAVTIGGLYDSGILPLAVKDRIADGLIKVAGEGRKFHAMIVALKAEYGSDISAVPKSKLAELDILFSSTVIQPLVDILSSLGVLPPGVASQVLLAISLVRTAISTISQIFGMGSASYEFHKQEVNGYAERRYEAA